MYPPSTLIRTEERGMARQSEPPQHLNFVCGSNLFSYQSWALATVAAAIHTAVTMNLRMAFLNYLAGAAPSSVHVY
jgi:hypothetical protein